ncbi:ribosomal protein S5 domain 2-type protein [Ochromonadaceae sp. CCMP2298]|nr:ribosomal protein S5 domain 2-type protein [Ochromonadaceae sp. CCMP2298]|mmetsp:Transcript_12151/g.27103  ORF Transcript_12151/g.27103 Transcript_12151/m.27103 type:complete len:296 (+) Transcript_12151:210-1097(+)
MNVAVADEIEVLNSIYGEGVRVEGNDVTSSYMISYADFNGKISFTVPPGYPDDYTPSFVLSFGLRMEPSRRQIIVDAVALVLAEGKGDVVLFSAIERFKELMALETEESADNEEGGGEETEGMDSGTGEVSGVAADLGNGMKIIHGPTTIENRSSFQSHIAAVHSMDDVDLFRRLLLSDKGIQRATHNISCFRFTCPTTGVVYHDSDDDGESTAGGRLAEMLRLMGVGGVGMGVGVVVSRWYGGIKLGPARFSHIKRCARNLLEDHGFATAAKAKADTEAKGSKGLQIVKSNKYR